MDNCKRCKKPTAFFPLNKYGKPSTMCLACYRDTMIRNAARLERAKQLKADPPPGMDYCMNCWKPRPIEEFQTNPKQRRKLANGQRATSCAKCRERRAEAILLKRREAHKDPAAKAAYLVERRDYSRKSRTLLIAAYGGRCACCGEDEPKFLELDHIDGGGGKHRKQIGNGTEAIYRWCAKNGFPKSMQLICANCHNAKSFWGVCPHQEKTLFSMMDKCPSTES